MYVPDQWYDVMRSAQKRNPFEVHEVVQEEVKDFGTHLMPYFKKSIRSGKKALHIQNSFLTIPAHIQVKYGLSIVLKMRTGASSTFLRRVLGT